MKRSTRIGQRATAQIEQILFGLRFVLLIGLGLEILTAPKVNSFYAGLVLGTLFLYSLLLLVLAIANVGTTVLPMMALIADSLFAVLLFAVSISLDSAFIVMVAGSVLFPVTAAALRLGWVRAFVAAVVVVFVDAGLYVFTQYELLLRSPISFTTFALSALMIVATAILVGFVGEQMRLQAIRRTHAERDQEEKRSKYVREQARIVYDMASLVSATLNYEKVFDAALDRCAAIMADTGAASSQMVGIVMLFREGVLHVVTSRRLTTADMRVTLPGTTGILAETINGGESVLSSKPYQDAELASFVALRNCRTLMAVPLESGVDHFGVMLFAHPRPDFFDLDHIELLEAICKHMVIAMQNAKLYQRLFEEKERIVEVEEEARKKLARDLHDGPTQSVAAIAMRANYIRRLMERDMKGAAEEIYKVEELARKTTKEIRHMLFTLRPLVLESQGLGAALQSLADKMRENFNQDVVVEADPAAVEKLDMHSQGVLFYIAEEAVGNARKHAQAEKIWVRLRMRSAEICSLEIQDNGVGFDVNAVLGSYENRGSLGMVNLRERTELVNGTLNLDSAPGKGTKITIMVPLSDEARQKLMG